MEPGSWLRGQLLEQWADRRTVERLPVLFAGYEEAEIWRALRSTKDQFRWLATERAASLGFSYPDEGERKTTALVHSLYKERSGRSISLQVKSWAVRMTATAFC